MPQLTIIDMAITNSDLRFKIDLYKVDKDFDLTDTTDYDGGSVDYASGMFKVVSPTGATVYQNDGWDDDDFSHPDTAYHLGDDVVADLELPTTVTGDIVIGEYTIYNKVRTYVAGTPTTKTCTISGKSISIASIGTTDGNKILAAGFIEFSTGEIYTIESGSMSTTTLNVTTVETPTLTTGSKTINIYNTNEDYSTSKKFKYSYTSPVVSIDYVLDCQSSSLTSTDSTDYDTTNCTDDISATTITRTHSVTAPKGSGFGAITDSADTTRVFIDIWTNVWQTTISTVLDYDIEEWDSVVWYTIHDTVTGYDSVDVQCDSCECDMLTCINALYTKWVSALTNNPMLAKELTISVQKVVALYMQSKIALQCGEDTSAYCNEAKQILSMANCSCSTSVDHSSKLVVKTSSYPSLAFAPLFGTTTPSSGIGNNGQVYYNTSTWDVYTKANGAWTLQGNIKGADGSDGTDGDYVVVEYSVDGSVDWHLDFNDTTDLYMRVSSDSGATFSKAMKIVGVDGANGVSTRAMMTIPISFNEDETGTFNIHFPFAATVSHCTGYVTHRIEPSNNGTAVISYGGVTKATMTFTAGATTGTTISNSLTSFSVTAGSTVRIATSKGNAGGTGYLILTYSENT